MKSIARCTRSFIWFAVFIAAVGSVRAQNTFPGSGNVGVGTLSPATPLEVRGTSGWNADGNITTFGTFEACRGLRIANRYAGNAAGISAIQSLYATTTCGVLDMPWHLLLNPDGGNVGIGTTNPAALLDIRGAGIASRLTITGTTGSHAKFQIYSSDIANNPFGEMQFYAPTGAGSEYLRFNVSNSSGTVFPDALTINRVGNVGVGTASPAAKLDVRGAIASNRNWFYLAEAGDTNHAIANVAGDGEQFRYWNFLDFYSPLGGGNIRMLSNGNVGIGTINPQNKLHVVGSITVDGNINAKYQDLAEWVPSSEQLSAGTVVVLDTSKSNQVISSSVSYDTRVAGVISSKPGITLGEGGEGKVLVATTGRVRVKVDASRAPVQIGDLLVTSDVAGVAMKSEAVNLGGVQIHRPGTIIGKALEPFAKGKGEILVLLSLQ